MQNEVVRRWYARIHETEEKIENAVHDDSKQREFQRLCREKGNPLRFLYVNGYFVLKPSDMKEHKEWLEERKKCLKSRYESLKIYRLNENWKLLRSCRTWLPYAKRLVISFVCCKDKCKAINAFALLTNYYSRLGDIYMYSPCSGSGYRYYSGEAVIIYVESENMKPKQLHDFRKAVYSTMANGYPIDQCYKIMLSTTTTTFKNFDSDWIVHSVYDNAPFVPQFIKAWKGKDYTTVDLKSYCKFRNFTPFFI